MIYLTTFWKNNHKFILFIVLMSVFRSAVAYWYTVPTGSMQPTIKEGDRIVVNKMAYDLKLPFSQISLFKTGEPERGDIVVFESVAADNRLIKRVVGLPGDLISMNNERLYINGKAVSLQTSAQENNIITAVEQLGATSHSVRINHNKSNQLSSFGPVAVPSDHYLVLGDNRRNSADSRVYGFVPREELKGKASHIAFSVDYHNFYIPRSERFFKDIYGI